LEAIHTILPEEQNQVNEMLENALRTSRNGLEETRRALKALRAEPLEDLGLKLAIQNLIANLEARTNLKFSLSIDDFESVFSQEEEQTIYRIAQEALENVVHHAKARNVWVNLTKNDNVYMLSIRDDGTGINPKVLTHKRDRMGIKGMRERAETINAEFDISSTLGMGTELKLTMRK